MHMNAHKVDTYILLLLYVTWCIEDMLIDWWYHIYFIRYTIHHSKRLVRIWHIGKNCNNIIASALSLSLSLFLHFSSSFSLYLLHPYLLLVFLSYCIRQTDHADESLYNRLTYTGIEQFMFHTFSNLSFNEKLLVVRRTSARSLHSYITFILCVCYLKVPHTRIFFCAWLAVLATADAGAKQRMPSFWKTVELKLGFLMPIEDSNKQKINQQKVKSQCKQDLITICIGIVI